MKARDRRSSSAAISSRPATADGGRDLIEQARRAALALRRPRSQGVRPAGPRASRSPRPATSTRRSRWSGRCRRRLSRRSFGEILEGLSDRRPHRRLVSTSAGIDIKIGDAVAEPQGPGRAPASSCRRSPPRRGPSGDAKVQARTLAIVAHLQARAGDFAGALATARSIPDLKRSDFPGPSDGFYDAVKPVTFALIAGVQAEAGDQSGRRRHARRGGGPRPRRRGRGPEAHRPDRDRPEADVACGRRDAAKAIVAEAIPLALTQPEPRRSRVLTMLAEAQVQAGDADGALRTIDAIRDYPGLEKARALSVLARRHEEAGDATASEGLLRRAVACLEAKAPEKPLPGKVIDAERVRPRHLHRPRPRGAPEQAAFHRGQVLQGLRTRRGDVEAAIREARAVPPQAFHPVAARRQLVDSQRRRRPRHGPRRVDPVPQPNAAALARGGHTGAGEPCRSSPPRGRRRPSLRPTCCRGLFDSKSPPRIGATLSDNPRIAVDERATGHPADRAGPKK